MTSYLCIWNVCVCVYKRDIFPQINILDNIINVCHEVHMVRGILKTVNFFFQKYNSMNKLNITFNVYKLCGLFTFLSPLMDSFI